MSVDKLSIYRELDALLEYITLSKELIQKPTRCNLRAASYVIIDFYKCTLTTIGRAVGENNLDSRNISDKFLDIRRHLPMFESKTDLIKVIQEIRNKVAHSDFSEPKKEIIEMLIEKSEPFLQFGISQLKVREVDGEQAKSIRDKLKDEIFNLGYYIDLNRSVGYTRILEKSELLKQLFIKLNIDTLDDDNVRIITELLEIETASLKAKYDLAWETCARCGGKITHKQDSHTNYAGRYDDMEPVSVTYSVLIQCEKCGNKLIDESETFNI